VDDLHQCLPDGAHHLAEEELDDCYLEEEELDGHLVQCAQPAQLVQAMLLAQMRQEKLSLAQQALPAQ
jgi:hypothetical protein